MALYGFGDLKDTALPSLWDTDEITKARLAEGASFEELVADVRVGLGGLNQEILGMPHYSSLFAVQDEPEVEYPIYTANGFEEATEYSVPDPRRGSTTGHMLPLKKYDRSMGWTMMYLREARRAKLDADIRSAMVDARDRWQKSLLNRFFSSTANTVGSTASADVPFADGGSADSTYIPPTSPGGETFAYTHEHFLDTSDTGITSSTFDATAVNTAIEHLQEHGHESPFELIGARADAADWADVPGFKPPLWPGIAWQGSAVERAQIGEIGNYFGYIETDYGVARVWLTPRLPTENFGVYKAYGPGDPRNPLRVRINRQVGFGFRLVPGNWVNAPLDLLLIYIEFGVGVGEDRTNGVCVDLGASGWTAPTIS